MRRQNKMRLKRSSVLAHFFLITGGVIVAFPFFWMLMTSFKMSGEAIRIPPSILPEKWTMDAYKKILSSLPFARIYINTIISTAATTVGQVLICSMAAYSFARIEFPFKNTIFLCLLSVLMVPGQIFLIPQYSIIMKMGLLDTLPALFMPNLFSAFGTFLLRQFFISIPKEIEEAAIVDGAGRLRIYFQIMMPLAKAGLISMAIFTIRFAWNDFMWPLIVNTSTKQMTLAAALSALQGQYLSEYPMQMAGAVLAIVPLVIVFFVFQKQFLEGVAYSGIKG